MNVECEFCRKTGKLGNGIIKVRHEGIVLRLCGKCRDNLEGREPSLLDRARDLARRK